MERVTLPGTELYLAGNIPAKFSNSSNVRVV